MHNFPRAQVKVISICLDFIVIALFLLIVFQFLRDFKLNKGLYRSIDPWSFCIEDKTFRILFTVGNVDRDIGRYSGRYSGR